MGWGAGGFSGPHPQWVAPSHRRKITFPITKIQKSIPQAGIERGASPDLPPGWKEKIPDGNPIYMDQNTVMTHCRDSMPRYIATRHFTPPPCESTATVPKVQANQRSNAQSRI